jgi:hypothetical protein
LKLRRKGIPDMQRPAASRSSILIWVARRRGGRAGYLEEGVEVTTAWRKRRRVARDIGGTWESSNGAASPSYVST